MQYGKHALALDENRADFDRVRWGEPHSTRAERDRLGNKTFEQVWFAGNHSDVGGGYSENELRLSDIALEWMINAAIAVPHPIKIDRFVLHVHPDPTGMQHDECKAGITYVTRYTGKTWKLQHQRFRDPRRLSTTRYDNASKPARFSNATGFCLTGQRTYVSWMRTKRTSKSYQTANAAAQRAAKSAVYRPYQR